MTTLPFILGLGVLIWAILESVHRLMGFRDERDPPRDRGPAIAGLILGVTWILATWALQRDGNAPVALVCFTTGLVALGYLLRA